MYEVFTLGDIDDPMIFETETPEEAAVEYAYLAFKEEWFHTLVDEAGEAIVTVRCMFTEDETEFKLIEEASHDAVVFYAEEVGST